MGCLGFLLQYTRLLLIIRPGNVVELNVCGCDATESGFRLVVENNFAFVLVFASLYSVNGLQNSRHFLNQ